MKILQTFLPAVLLFVLICFQLATSTQAQNSISISPVNSVAMDFTAPVDAGSQIMPVTDESKWLNYNITVTPPDPNISIAVEITSGTIFEGLQLQLQAGTFSGTGGGSPGVPVGTLILSNTPQVLIGNIGTCDSGSGTNVGHQLTYTMSISDYSAIKASSSTVNILFTITQ
jgi:hypothetical protein